MSDEYEEADFDEEDFQEAPEATGLRKYDEIVFCPHDGAYMPFRTHGAIVRRHCGTCGRYYEGSLEVSPEEVASLAAAEAAGSVTAPKKTAAAAEARAAVEAERPASSKKAGAKKKGTSKKASGSKAGPPAKKATPAKKAPSKPAKAKKATPAKKAPSKPAKAKKAAPAKKGATSTKSTKKTGTSKGKKGAASSGKKKTATKRADTKRNTKTARRVVQSTGPDRCAALTASGIPCRNPPRGRSKYCSSHKGWRPPRA